ncbi:MAG: deoxynucleoside kinase [Nitrososphaerota archaeon]|jgi:deoxyadenosine/deoxycytidine kinase|nr:deoxynucleoside kinase [Nitrososphaerota archaeon]MDG6948938.1 deoxynucleoside kinase [Nitrososphaerota archaeon]
MEPSYVVIGGPLASGKTTLARHLAELTGARLLFEQFANHPLIDDFYKDPKRYALQTEMVFTIMHYHDIAKAARDGAFAGAVVSDLFFDGVEAYTGYTLEPEDRKPFIRMFRSLQEKVPVPSLVVALDASTEFLMERLKSRGREYEKSVTFEYLDGVNRAFKAFMEKYRRAPVVVMDAKGLYDMGADGAAKKLESVVRKMSRPGNV